MQRYILIMTLIELLIKYKATIKILREAGVRWGDEGFINLYLEYVTLLNQGEKVSYIVAKLSDQYSVSERKVYDLIKRFKNDCNIPAV